MTDPVLATANAVRITGLTEFDLENWNRIREPFGILLTEGLRKRRMYSAMDVLYLRLVLALCGPTAPGSRSRQFLSPVIAHGIVGMMIDQFIAVDAAGRLKEPGPIASQRFLVVWCAADEDNLTADILHGSEAMEALGNIDDQMLVVPLTKLVHQTIVACCEVMQPQAEARSASGLRRAAGEGR